MKTKRIKILIATLLLICTLSSLFSSALASEALALFPNITEISLNSQEPRKLLSYEINGYNYYKLRDLAMLLSGSDAQFNIVWNEEAQMVSLEIGKPYIPVGGECSLDSKGILAEIARSSCTLYINNKQVELYPYLINGNNYFKLRDIMLLLDVNVKWDSSTKLIILNTEKSYESAWTISNSKVLLTTEQIAEKAASVVMLQLYDNAGNDIGLASGFFITSDGWIATCYHAVEDVFRCEVICDDGSIYPVSSVISYDAAYDTAIIKADITKEVKPLNIAYSSTLVRGQQVMTIGSPQGEYNSISVGHVSSTCRDAKGLRCDDARDIQISAPISKGSSGGPLIDMYGNVVGIVYALHNFGQNINYAIRTEEFLMLFDHLGNIPFSDFYKLTKSDTSTENELTDENAILKTNSGSSAAVSFIS